MKHRFSIMKRAYLRVGVWLILFLMSLYFFFSNIRFSEEFTWWVKITIAWKFDESKIKTDLWGYLKNKWYKIANIWVEPWIDTTKISLMSKGETDEKVNSLSKDIQSFLIQDKYVSSTDKILEQSITGPSVGSYMQRTAKNALIVGLILMAVYMLFSFAGVRKEIAPSVLALVVILTMIFDIALPAWAYGIRMWLNHTVTVDTVFIIAILTTMWYSINDTIIIFDRIRENIKNKAGQKWLLFGKIFEDSLWQTMRRSFGTIFSTLLVIIAMYILWTWVIKQFAFTIWIWVLFGSYSSIFVSAPLVYIILGKYKKERKQMLELK